jgi:CDP-diacylglycerol---glycerol-3-phosphate 3-phosphatidyltransferase
MMRRTTEHNHQMISIYQLKPAFQNLLRPIATGLAKAGVTANQVTVLAMLISIGLGAWLTYAVVSGQSNVWFALIPIWFFLRMAFNAIDGMLAREFGQKSALGAYLNELSDVVSDAALYLPFAFVAPFAPIWVFAVIFVAALSEMAGAIAPMVGAARRYDGPIGKSDRAFVFGALGLWVAAAGPLPAWIKWLMPLLIVLMLLNIINRIKNGIKNGVKNSG